MTAPALVAVLLLLASCADAQAAEEAASPAALWQALAIVGGLVVALGAVALASSRLTEAARAWTWALVRPHVKEATDGLVSRAVALEERSETHRRAIYGDEHQGGILDRLRALQAQHEAQLDHLAQLRREAIDASDRHTAALRELAAELRRGDR
jgi:hypothetical protein